ncbi:hypothetical protein [Haloferula sp. A504]|uniref:hypothetical protein n=1 Tax=Haloferula sp. A504 TaxID=3373601 RepID=UPI0031C873AB|nr:matrixin family metalloprotease [Verrucomicrobiaceae bacterium E54]
MRPLPFLSALLATSASAIQIQVDYTYDTDGYFDIPERRQALEAAAQFYSDLLSDNLLRVDPSEFPGGSWTVFVSNPQTGATESLPNPVVPEDILIVFAGARELGGTVRGQGGTSGYSGFGSAAAWFSRIRARGNPGADVNDDSLATDFAPSFGFVTFDITTDFNFSSTPHPTKTDFIPVALHEFAHVLGIGTAASWDNLINSNTFTGPAVVQSAGSAPAVQTGGGHFDQSVSNKPAYGSFGTPHGSSGAVMMRPSLTGSSGGLTVATDLDLAGLLDIGWEVSPPAIVEIVNLGPSATELEWPSSSFLDYVVEKDTDLDFSNASQFSFSGDGFVKSWTDPAPPAGKAFYRLVSEPFGPAAVPAAPSAPLRTEQVNEGLMTVYVAPRWVEGCGCSDH